MVERHANCLASCCGDTAGAACTRFFVRIGGDLPAYGVLRPREHAVLLGRLPQWSPFAPLSLWRRRFFALPGVPLEPLRRYIDRKRIYLNVPFGEKEDAKAAGDPPVLTEKLKAAKEEARKLGIGVDTRSTLGGLEVGEPHMISALNHGSTSMR